jgi:hypothetical protein
MVVDHADTKAPEAPKVIDPPAAEKQGINLEILESSAKGAQKNRGKPYCWRFRSKGHTIHECSIVLCCEICYGDHKTKLCPNMKKQLQLLFLVVMLWKGLGFISFQLLRILK